MRVETISQFGSKRGRINGIQLDLKIDMYCLELMCFVFRADAFNWGEK
jgi:hypothetical protein